MQNIEFYQNSGPYKLSQICDLIGYSNINISNKDLLIYDVSSIESAKEGELAVLHNIKYLEMLLATQATVCIVPKDVVQDIQSIQAIVLEIDNPHFAYASIMDLFYSSHRYITKNNNYNTRNNIQSVMSTARIAHNASIGNNANIGNNVIIGSNSKIGNNVTIGNAVEIGNDVCVGHNIIIEDEAKIANNTVIGSNSIICYKVSIGNNCNISPQVYITHSIVGDFVVIEPGAKIGTNGFGFAEHNGNYKQVPHIGRVIIGNHVAIGANTTINRGSIQDTIVEDHCRIDNLVQIAHNVHLKKGCILAGQVGIAGSSVIGEYSSLGGQVGIAGHLNIHSNVKIAAKSGVMKDVKQSMTVGGIPAVPIKQWHKQSIMLKKIINNK
ncbi:UDP-3-O-(3-hydroxymyristoyl)glucosamine N-acyltransferase [Rickettsia endosymbiont of Cardiosporidium cionae]|uniref:UDP-3-O-(3-hydroxymyristoyl)glucosamine N-acyltransferase n=1 Tax=Rickettsia endosymbiont of Cardiosporidium cionae TaxID=2777155 RepID=UPI001892D2A1|nr:UDP-3-O-(3-hydroxymyristoyl)glucosamine N-acyltransferase [Rickettsia endosymbiont of Cardiosporidium cionae]KAF8818266.1 UDP-3-O-(3-hydroxymyristoyl)glucosamine N-acyltransferase [Rickettsia endosymbiont of Cardiosporidium cionae]